MKTIPEPLVAASLATARWCAGRRWPVHPLAAGRKAPAANCIHGRSTPHSSAACPCLPAGRWCHRSHAATLDQRRIDQWWGTHPDFGVDIACGPAGLVVIDSDAHQTQPHIRDRILPGISIADYVDLTGLTNGFHTLAVLAALRDQPSPAEDGTTLRVRTPSGGLRVWYRATDSRRWRCSSGSSRGRVLAWQVDVRAHGGYIIAPGTTTPDGTYTPADTVREPATLLKWRAQELERTGHLPIVSFPAARSVPPRAERADLAAGTDRDRTQRMLASVLAPVEACGRASEGAGFSATLNRAAYTLGGRVAAGRLYEEEAEQALAEAAAATHLRHQRRAEQIIRGGMNAGLRHPWGTR
ncbi:bifunctional DNA primase/polymerase [Streptomyces sp. NPDC051445]|uniref:bifunctional DNA primase/polymerase n=1 Tax=Streptomyces sp. NPDC051445 TaxID=3365653 RepID=UPI0037BB86D3